MVSDNFVKLIEGETENLEILLNENSYKLSGDVAFTFQICGLFMEGHF